MLVLYFVCIYHLSLDGYLDVSTFDGCECEAVDIQVIFAGHQF